MALRDVFLFFLLVAMLRERHKLYSGQTDPLKDRLDLEKDFLQPESLSGKITQFVYKDRITYIIVSDEHDWNEARTYCQSNVFKGILAIIDEEEKLEFLSEALIETSHSFDNLWVAGLRDIFGRWSTSYVLNNNIQYLPTDLIDKYNGTKNRFRLDVRRDCLSYRRAYNNTGNFIDLHCGVQRPLICQKAYNYTALNMSSTHPGWFRIEQNYFKIFYDEVSWANASINCQNSDKFAKLAYVSNYSEALILSRYLLIGRPSLENAWIGARWDFEENAYVFEGERVKLENVTNEGTNYPPWPSSTMMKSGGCVLLDRHLEKKTLFVPARCQRLRPYICYKAVYQDRLIDNNTFIFPHGDYLLHYQPLVFPEAVSACTYMINGHHGILAQPTSLKEINDVLFIMGEGVTYIQHIWLGGKLFNGKWRWLLPKKNASLPDEAGAYIPIRDKNGYPPWVDNTTYTEEVENMNLCLNMDREEHLYALFYGADCSYAQSFICKYPAGALLPPKNTANPSSTVNTPTVTAYSTVTASSTVTTTPVTPTMETRDFPDLTILPQLPQVWEKENNSTEL